MSTSEERRKQALAAHARASKGTDLDLIRETKRHLVAVNIERDIEKRLEGAPPLNPSQVDMLVGLIEAGGAR